MLYVCMLCVYAACVCYVRVHVMLCTYARYVCMLVYVVIVCCDLCESYVLYVWKLSYVRIFVIFEMFVCV